MTDAERERKVRLREVRDELHAEVVARSGKVEYTPDSVYAWLIDQLTRLTVDMEEVKNRLGT